MLREDLEENAAFKAAKQLIEVNRRRVTEEKKLATAAKKRLSRKGTGRKAPPPDQIRELVLITSTFGQFNEAYYKTFAHRVSKSTYHRWKRQFGAKS